MIFISHHDASIDWQIVSGNSFVVWIRLVIQECEVGRNGRDFAFLHFETIRVGPKLSLWIKVIEHFEVDCDVFVSTVCERHRIKLDLDLYLAVQKVRVTDVHFCPFVSGRVLKTEGPLLDERSILIKCIWMRQTILQWPWLFP